MNFPKITLKSKFPSQMLSNSPKESLPLIWPRFWWHIIQLDFLIFSSTVFLGRLQTGLNSSVMSIFTFWMEFHSYDCIPQLWLDFTSMTESHNCDWILAKRWAVLAASEALSPGRMERTVERAIDKFNNCRKMGCVKYRQHLVSIKNRDVTLSHSSIFPSRSSIFPFTMMNSTKKGNKKSKFAYVLLGRKL